MAENICPRCGAQMNIDTFGNASCEYCGYKKISDASILSARGKAEIDAKRSFDEETKARNAREAAISQYNAKINMRCVDYADAAKPVKKYDKRIKTLSSLMFLPIVFLILLLTEGTDSDGEATTYSILLGVSVLADIVLAVVIALTAIARKRANVNLSAIRADVFDMLAAHPYGDRSAEIYDWLNQFDKEEEKKE